MKRPSCAVGRITSSSSASSSSSSSASTYTDYDAPPKGEAAKNPKVQLARKLRKARLEFLNDLSLDSNEEAFNRLVADALKKNEGDLTVLVMKLHKLDDEKNRKKRLSDIVAAADAVLAQLDETEIALALTGRAEADSKEAKEN